MENYLKMAEEYIALYGMKVIGAILILIIGLWLAKFISRVFNKTLTKRNVDPTLVKFFTGFIRGVLIVFVLIAAIDQVGVATTSFVAVLGAAGLAVGLALQGSLSNFASGVMLIIFRPIRVGDYIEAGGQAGTVLEIGIFVTVLKSPDNKRIYVPNSGITSGNIVNYSATDTRRVDMVFGIGYSDDIDKAKKVIADVLKNDSRVLDDPAPQIVVSALADSSVNFNVRPWVNSADYWGVYFDTTETIKKRFDAENISIPFPQRDVHLHQA
jgi:small conductance mechanosensitive channel